MNSNLPKPKRKYLIDNASIYITIYTKNGKHYDNSAVDFLVDQFCRREQCYTVYFPLETRILFATPSYDKFMLVMSKKDKKLADDIFISLTGRLLSYLRVRLTELGAATDCSLYIVYKNGTTESIEGSRGSPIIFSTNKNKISWVDEALPF